MGPESQRIVPAQWLRSSDRYTFPCAGPTDTVEPCQCHIGNIVKHVEATALPELVQNIFYGCRTCISCRLGHGRLAVGLQSLFSMPVFMAGTPFQVYMPG